MFFLMLLKHALGENLKYSEMNSRGFTKLPDEFALPSIGGVLESAAMNGPRFCWLGVWIDVTIFQMDLIWAVFCRNSQLGLVVDTGWDSAVANLMRFLPEMQNASKSALTSHPFLIISKVENKICPGP